MVRIAVTGHMNLTTGTADLVQDAIGAELVSYAPNELVGVSCLARGADSVFARAVLDHGGKLEVVLPARGYRETKVKPDHEPMFDELMRRAANVVVMDFDTPGREAYEAANEAVLSSCDRLIAVWDGKVGERGGTASVVQLASRRGVPVTVVWPEGASRA